MRPSSICTTGPNTLAVPFPVPTPASSVGSIVLVPEVSLPLFVPAFQAYKPNQLCERNPTLSNLLSRNSRPWVVGDNLFILYVLNRNIEREGLDGNFPQGGARSART